MNKQYIITRNPYEFGFIRLNPNDPMRIKPIETIFDNLSHGEYITEVKFVKEHVEQCCKHDVSNLVAVNDSKKIDNDLVIQFVENGATSDEKLVEAVEHHKNGDDSLLFGYMLTRVLTIEIVNEQTDAMVKCLKEWAGSPVKEKRLL
jgi:hypothetical protein